MRQKIKTEIFNSIAIELGLKVELAKFSDVYFCSVYKQRPEFILSNSVSTGMAKTPELAYFKAVTEFVERTAFAEGSKAGDISCNTSRSDGFAAFPITGNPEMATEQARANAVGEAIERFAWATWWDNEDIGFQIQIFDPDRSDWGEVNAFTKAIWNRFNLSKLVLVRPYVANSSLHSVISIAFTGIGYCTGGATSALPEDSLFRALGELFRHLIAGEAAVKQPNPPDTFYIKRLLFFYRGAGNHLVKRRLNKCGSRSVKLPPLTIDRTIKHRYSDKVVVHRCLFEGQPDFVAGKINRLCL